MLKVMTSVEPLAVLPPWRKRHPLLARTLLYGAGLGLAALLLVLLVDRQADDERTRILALQAELDGLSLMIAMDKTGDSVLAKLDEKFTDPELPLVTRGRALRWRAMAWRRKAMTASSEEERAGAIVEVEKALTACEALDLAPAERVALHLEWAEARLERPDVRGGETILPAASELHQMPHALLYTLLRAQGMRLDDRGPASVELVRTALLGLEGPLDTETQTYVGGRTWTAVQVAVELANYLTRVGEPAGARAAWNRLRAAAPRDFETQASAARGLARGNAGDDALSAWRAAQALDARLAAIEAARDPVLGRLEERRADR